MINQYTVSKRGQFSASHSVDCFGSEHKCNNVHGHNYDFEIHASKIIETGKEHYSIEFSTLKRAVKKIEALFDHRHLNNIINVPPTAENLLIIMAGIFYNDMKISGEEGVTLDSIVIHETRDSSIKLDNKYINVNEVIGLSKLWVKEGYINE